jgi:CheY-like chemotaxis protein
MNRILVVDDDSLIRGLVANILEDDGYKVTQAVDGREGLEKWREGSFDLVVSDMTMPVMDGRKMLESMRREDEDVRLIILSGNTPEDLGVPFLSKPFDVKKLTGLVGRMIK